MARPPLLRRRDPAGGISDRCGPLPGETSSSLTRKEAQYPAMATWNQTLRSLRVDPVIRPRRRPAGGDHADRARLPAHRRACRGDRGAGGGAARRGLRLRHAGRHRRAGGRTGHRLRPVPDRLDRAEHHLPLPADGGERILQAAAGDDRRRDAGPALAAAADRLRLRRLLRGRGRLRHAGGGDRRGADRARLLAARRLGPLADRQYRPGRLWRARHAGDRAGAASRARPDGPVGDDRPAAALLLAHRAVLADLGLRRVPRDAGDLAGDPGDRRVLRRAAVPRVQLHGPLPGRRDRGAGLAGLPVGLPAGLAAEGDLDERQARRPRRGGRGSHGQGTGPRRPAAPAARRWPSTAARCWPGCPG